MKRPEVERMRALLVEAITTLCRSGLQYNANLKVEGLIGITLDEADIILVNLNKTFGSGLEEIASPSKSQKGHDRLAMSDDEISHDSFLQEPSSPRERRKERQRKRRESAAAQEAKRCRMTPTKDHSSDSSSQFHISNTYSLTSPDSHGGGTEKKSTEADSHEAVPSASSVESALTTTSRNMSDSNTPSRPESASNQDNRVNNQGSHSAQKSETVVKIEIDSDPEVEEVKVEPAPSQSCSLAQVHSYQPQSTVSDTSLSTTFPPDLSQAIPSLSASDVQGELFASQLPPEFSAAAQSDPNAVPVGMFSNTLAQPVAGPSGLNMSHAGGAPFIQGDALAARAGQLQAGQKTKLAPVSSETHELGQVSIVMGNSDTFRKRNDLDLQSKYELIIQLESGISRKVIAQKFGINVRTVGKLWERREEIKALFHDSDVDKSSRRVRSMTTTYNNLEHDMSVWYMSEWMRRKSVTWEEIQDKAKDLATHQGLAYFHKDIHRFMDSFRKRVHSLSQSCSNLEHDLLAWLKSSSFQDRNTMVEATVKHSHSLAEKHGIENILKEISDFVEHFMKCHSIPLPE